MSINGHTGEGCCCDGSVVHRQQRPIERSFELRVGQKQGLDLVPEFGNMLDTLCSAQTPNFETLALSARAFRHIRRRCKKFTLFFISAFGRSSCENHCLALKVTHFARFDVTVNDDSSIVEFFSCVMLHKRGDYLPRCLLPNIHLQQVECICIRHFAAFFDASTPDVKLAEGGLLSSFTGYVSRGNGCSGRFGCWATGLCFRLHFFAGRS
mmetsp:Transcript_70357/g.139528  ORF Transcript_70357/g.139528 Transcript_70357/m.139528 type:complete len:210 (+) Transcript_70357:178-807(+)